jgi:type III secretion protein T
MNNLITFFPQIVISLALCSPRIIVAFTIAPFFSSEYVTGITRNCIAISFSLILIPTILPSVGDRDITLLVFLAIVAKEGAIGAALGYGVGLFFWGVQSIGQLIDYQRGAIVAETYDPFFGSQVSPMGHFLISLVMLIFFSTGGFLIFLSSLYESYQAWPILSYLPKPNASAAIFSLEKIDDFMEMVLLLASPIVIIMFLSDFGLGLINRFAPQLNIFFLTMPIKSALCVLFLILYFPVFISYLKNYLFQSADIFNMLKSVMQ